MRYLFLVLLLSTAANARPLGPGNPPPGANDFRRMAERADWVRDSVAKVAPGANLRCVWAVALEMVGLAELAWSNDVAGRAGKPRSVQKGAEAEFKESLRKNARNECNDFGGPGQGGTYDTVRGLLSFAADHSKWTSTHRADMEADVLRAAQALMPLGVGVGAASGGAAAAPASIPLIILDPRLFMPAATPDGA